MGCYLAGSLLITDASVKTLVIIWTWFAALPLLEQGEGLRLSLSLSRYRLVVILYIPGPRREKMNRGKHPFGNIAGYPELQCAWLFAPV